MRKSMLVLSLATLAAAPTLAHAGCEQRKAVGTVAGAVGGGLIGAAAGGRAGLPWGFLGAGVGALAGRAIAGAGCHRYAYYHHARYWRRARYERPDYDRRWAYGAPAYGTRCQVENQSYFDANGRLIQRTARVCS